MSNRDFLSLVGRLPGSGRDISRGIPGPAVCVLCQPLAHHSPDCAPYLCRPSQGLHSLLFPTFPRPCAGSQSWPHPNPIPRTGCREGGFFALWTEWKQTDRLSRNSSKPGASGDSVRLPPGERTVGHFSGRFMGQRGGGQEMMQTEKPRGGPRAPFLPGGRDRPVLWGPTAHGAAGGSGEQRTLKPESAQGQEVELLVRWGRSISERGRLGPQSEAPAGPLQKLDDVVRSGGFVVGRGQSARGRSHP